ncbi:MAG TPA: glycoside hydrolase family 15 protein [Leptospiraceae bacterium]|nr:glycoside hydrolase family 15 protein [Leptospiraceae bacterium]
MHKYNIGIIGNCSFLAYIDTQTNVKWMCMPRFDSSFIFGSLIDSKKGGQFQIIPGEENNIRYEQYYLENTNILITEVHSDKGKFRVTDFAPRFHQHDRYFRPLMLIRKIEVVEGNPDIKVICNPVYDYGNTKPVLLQGSNHIQYNNLGSPMRLTTNIPLSNILSESSFLLTEPKYLVFTYGEPFEVSIERTCEEFLKKTILSWRKWVKTTYVPTIYQEHIIRSALALKLHQYEDTGGIIAAGTTSLPEFNESTRNWDYRYCWMRDTYYTLRAFNSMGHFEELERYFRYIENILHRETDRIQPLYSITGESKLTESELPLEGYLGINKPVRIGNDAYTHIQNDVYGQVLASTLPLYVDKRLAHHPNLNQDMIYKLVRLIEKTIDEPDAGLWEFRHRTQLHCYTFLFQWVGAKAAGKIAINSKDDALLQLAVTLEKKAAAKIEECYHPKLKAYTQAVGNDYMDASCLQLITMNYLDPKSERAALHLKAIEEKLVTPEGLVYRYIHEDDFGKPQSTFLICSFWYVEALACVGRLEEAQRIFEKLLKKATNHLNLLSEDIMEDGSQWGNFPQTYSHVGLMNAAFRIARKLDRPIFF